MKTDISHPERIIEIDYTNHQGERRQRRIKPYLLWFGSTSWHPEKQWLLDAKDMESSEREDFAMKGVHGWRDVEKTK